MKQIFAAIENTFHHVKKIINSLIKTINHELMTIMVNKGRIHEELDIYFRYIQNLIKLNNELGWKLGK